MSATSVRDMTKGNITRHLIGFTLPLLLGNLFQQLYNMVDCIIVGQYVGRDALGAVGSVGSINFLCFSLCLGLGNGIGILVSQFFGAGEDEKVKQSIGQALYVTLISGAIMSIIGGCFARQILTLMGSADENFDYALTYMTIVCGFTFINAIYNSISAILRSLGDATTPLKFLIVASVVNVILDLLFVVKFDWGVAGAAYATVFSQGIAAAGSIIYGIHINPYLRLKKEHFKVRGDLIKREVRIGLPLAAQSSTIAISCVILQAVVNGFGPTVTAAYASTNRLEQLVQQPYNTLGIAMSTFAGQNFGAGKKERIMQAAKKGIAIVVGFSLLMIIVMYAFGPNLVGLFVDDKEVIDIGTAGLRFTSFCYVFLGLIYVMRGLLNGVGDVFFSMINGIIEVSGRIGFTFILIYMLGLDFHAVWYTNGLTWSLTGIISAIRFYRAKWRNKNMEVYDEQED